MTQLVKALTYKVVLLLTCGFAGTASAHSIMPNGNLEFNAHKVTSYTGDMHRVAAGELKKSGKGVLVEQHMHNYMGGGCCHAGETDGCLPQVGCPVSSCVPQDSKSLSATGIPECVTAPVTVERIQKRPKDNTLYPGRKAPQPSQVPAPKKAAGIILRDQTGL